MNSPIEKTGIAGAMFALGLFGTVNPPALGQAGDPPAAEVANLKINGEVGGEKAGFVITGDFKPRPEEEKEKLIFSARTENNITHRRGQTEQNISGTVKILQGETAELRFAVQGKGSVGLGQERAGDRVGAAQRQERPAIFRAVVRFRETGQG